MRFTAWRGSFCSRLLAIESTREMIERIMADREDIKKKIKQIYEVLPKLDDQRCGYRTCGEFARAAARGEAPCYGCVTGGPEIAAKVCEITGSEFHGQAIPQYNNLRRTETVDAAGLGRRIGRGTRRGGGPGRGYFARQGRSRRNVGGQGFGRARHGK